MLATTTAALDLTKKEAKARRKAEKKRLNKMLGSLGDGLDNLTHAIYGVQDRVAEAHKAVLGFDANHPTQALKNYLDELSGLLAKGMEMAQEQGQPARDALTEHLFPGRAAKWAGRDDEQNGSRRYAQAERGFGA